MHVFCTKYSDALNDVEVEAFTSMSLETCTSTQYTQTGQRSLVSGVRKYLFIGGGGEKAWLAAACRPQAPGEIIRENRRAPAGSGKCTGLGTGDWLGVGKEGPGEAGVRAQKQRDGRGENKHVLNPWL